MNWMYMYPTAEIRIANIIYYEHIN